MKKPEQAQLLEWIQRGRQGDPEAQEALIRAAQNSVYYHCKKILKQEQDAQDAAQDVLITVITSLDKLKEPAAFWGWVNGITANRCRHLLSVPHKEWQIPEDEEGNSMLDSLENLDEQLVPEKALDNEETRKMILGLVDSLPAEQRMCVLFYYYDEMSVRDIAQAMETSEGTVKSRLNYARKAIKAGVEDYASKGIKLYSVSPLLLLAALLRQEGAAFLLDSASSTALVGKVMARAGEAAAVAAGTAAGSTAAAGTAVGETAAAATGTAAAGSAAGEAAAAAVGTAAGGAAAGGAGAAAGISAKVVAGVLAGLVAVGGATAGIATLMSPDEGAASSSVAAVLSAPMPQVQPEAVSVVEEAPEETVEEEVPEEPEGVPEEPPQAQPEPVPQPEPEPEPTPFAVARGLSIGAPATYSNLPATPLCSDPEVTALPSTCTISAPSISSSADGAGYVTYTVSYTVTTKCHLGTTKTEPADTPYTIWYESYNVYDYYTGSTYFAPHLDTVGGQTSDGASATGEHNGQSFSVTGQASAQKVAEAGSDWVESQSGDYTYEIHSDLVYRITMTVRAPADYDGLMLGLNVVDAPNPSAGTSSLTSGSPSHYRFVRLG